MADKDKAFEKQYNTLLLNNCSMCSIENHRKLYNAGVEYGRANPVLQPMETAPKPTLCEGTLPIFIDLWRDGERFPDAYWRDCWMCSHTQHKLRYDFDGWTPIPKVTNE